MLPDPDGGPASPDGPCLSVQAAEIEIDRSRLDDVWDAEHLERLARAYWEFIERRSLGILRVDYRAEGRAVVLLSRRLPLLSFREPSYAIKAGEGRVSWPIDRGILVAREGRGQGYLRIVVRRLGDPASTGPGPARIEVRAEVSNFYPLLRGKGRFARFGARFYNATQLRAHVWITRGFLRSLGRRELPASRVGALSGR